MTDQFAQTTFVTGVDEKLATADTYSKDVKTSINNATSSFKDTSKKVMSVLSGAKVVQDLTDFKNLGKNNPLATARAITNRLTSISPELGKLSDTFTLLKSVGGIASTSLDWVNNANAEINGITRIFDKRNFESISTVMGAITQLSYSNFPMVLSDVGTMIGVKSLVIQEALGLKVPGVVKALTDNVTDAVELNGIVKNVSKDIVSNSDLGALGEIADNAKCASSLISQSPDVLVDFAKSYTLPAGTTTGELGGIGNSINSTYSKLDPDWNMTTRNGVSTPDLTVIANGSMDFKAAVRASDASTEINYFTGMGTAAQIAVAVTPVNKEDIPIAALVIEPVTKKITNTDTNTSSDPNEVTAVPASPAATSALLDSLSLSSIETVPVGQLPEHSILRKWVYLGTKNIWVIWVDTYGVLAVKYLKGQAR